MKDGESTRHYRIEAVGESKFHLQGVCEMNHLDFEEEKSLALQNVSRFAAPQAQNSSFQSSSPDFSSLQELVTFHKLKRAGLTTTLKDPCPKDVQAKLLCCTY